MLLSTRCPESRESFLLCVGLPADRCAEIARLLGGATAVIGVPDVESAHALLCGEAVYVEAAEGRDASAKQPLRRPRLQSIPGYEGWRAGSGDAEPAESRPPLPAGSTPSGAESLRVDIDQRLVTWQGEIIELSAREFELLAALAQQPGRVWTFADLTEKVWRRRYVGDAEAVVSAVKRLRRRIAAATSHIRVDSVRGVGFRLTFLV